MNQSKRETVPATPAAAENHPVDQVMGMVTSPGALIEEMDNRLIMAGLTGQEIAEFLYNIPFRDSRGRKEWSVPDCPLCKSKTPHRHVAGVSIAGINEIARVAGGYARWPISCEPATFNGVSGWLARAAAYDEVNINFKVEEYFEPGEKKRFGGEGTYEVPNANIIAASKAERNAMKALLPQALINALKNKALAGIKFFTPQEAERLVNSFGGASRKAALRAMGGSSIMRNFLPAGVVTAPGLPAPIITWTDPGVDSPEDDVPPVPPKDTPDDRKSRMIERLVKLGQENGLTPGAMCDLCPTQGRNEPPARLSDCTEEELEAIAKRVKG